MPGRDGERSGTGVSLERHIRAAFTERLAYKAAALNPIEALRYE